MVVAQLEERSLRKGEICSSNPVIGKMLSTHCIIEKTKKRKRNSVHCKIATPSPPIFCAFQWCLETLYMWWTFRLCNHLWGPYRHDYSPLSRISFRTNASSTWSTQAVSLTIIIKAQCCLTLNWNWCFLQVMTTDSGIQQGKQMSHKYTVSLFSNWD